MKNYEIVNINEVLGGLFNDKIKGYLKFKLFKNKRTAESALELIIKSLEDVEEESERQEIMDSEQDLAFDKFTLDELEPLALSMADLSMLESVINFGEEA